MMVRKMGLKNDAGVRGRLRAVWAAWAGPERPREGPHGTCAYVPPARGPLASSLPPWLAARAAVHPRAVRRLEVLDERAENGLPKLAPLLRIATARWAHSVAGCQGLAAVAG